MFRCQKIELEQDLPWDELVQKSNTATFFQTRDWLMIWLKHFPVEHKIVGIYEGRELIGIVPFALTTLKGLTLKGVDFLGVSKVSNSELVSDFGDVIAKTSYEEIVWREVLANLKSQISNLKSLVFNFIREDSPSFKILQELGGKAEEIDVAPYIDLPTSWVDYLVSLERHNRHELRRKMRKPGSATISKGGPSDIDEFFRLMTLGSEQKGNFLKPGMKAFFRDIITVFWPKKYIDICFLNYEGRNIAAVILFIFRDEVLLYNSGFDPEFSHLSPGLVLKAYAIKEAIEKGRKRFDFLRGGERYKYDLGGKERKLYRFTF